MLAGLALLSRLVVCVAAAPSSALVFLYFRAETAGGRERNGLCPNFSRVTTPASFSCQLFENYFTCQLLMPTFREILYLPTSRGNFTCQLFENYFTCQLLMPTFREILYLPTSRGNFSNNYFTCQLLMPTFRECLASGTASVLTQGR